eukprot:7075026-Pyramimonas_sp.AAC.1
MYQQFGRLHNNLRPRRGKGARTPVEVFAKRHPDSRRCALRFLCRYTPGVLAWFALTFFAKSEYFKGRHEWVLRAGGKETLR